MFIMLDTNACGIVICGVHTDIAIELYSNRIFLIVSQFKKFGSMISVSREASLSQFTSDVYSTKTLFGADDEKTHAAARYISEQIDVDRPVLMSICLKDYSKNTLDTIVDAIGQIRSW